MPVDNEVLINMETLPQSRTKFPQEDFVDAQFDTDFSAKTTDALIILSTPRSGSTFLCDFLYRNKACIAHEYFQQPDYMPLLADRWDCIGNGSLENADYIEKLLKYRTLENGWLGINLHGSHIHDYLKLEEHLAGVRKHYLHLQRRDLLAQAVSFEMAAQSKKWTTHFKARFDVSYDYDGIYEKVARINNGNLLIQAFIQANGIACPGIYYEDLIHSPQDALAVVPGVNPHQLQAPATRVTRQATRVNETWVERFANEHLKNTAPVASKPQPGPKSILSRARDKLRR